MIKDKSENETESIIFDDKVNQLMAHVFGLTLCRDSDSPAKRSLVFIETDSIEHAVFERLMLSDPKSKVQDADGHVVQTQVIIYLYECYHRLKHYPINSNLEETIRNACQIVLRNANTALQEPDLFQYQEVHSQFVALFMDDVTSKSELSLFVNDMIEELIATNRESDIEDIITKSFAPVLDIVHKEAAQSNLFTFRQQWFVLLHIFSTIEPLAKLIICHSRPKNNQGCAYSDTLLAKYSHGKYDMDSYGQPKRKVTQSFSFLTQMLDGKMGLLGVLCVSDGFMLNVGNVLLRLCQPFCTKFNDKNTKIPKIDPTYCSAQVKDEAESLKYGIHMKELSSETCLIPTPEGESRPIADSYGFTTECFFLTHRALDLGYRVILDKFLKTNQDLARIQRAYNDAQIGGSSEVLELITQRMETEMIKY
ncbi:ubiquitin conjugation factor e4 a [Lasius niger]|uniref:RING-type E3 ubiquitin transferase n=1 Tax=Lasius niger TaxID=67767 RepID=A0A0J7MYK6_LASNI|nr:ubiquitin conjugation factor e4 a [Lasius niger]